MNKSDHQAFRLFSQTHSPAITAVFVELYHWGTITWAGHAAGDWFYKSIRKMSEDLKISLKTVQRAYQLIKDGKCPFFKSEVRMKGNFPVTWFKVVKKEEELSTNTDNQKDYNEENIVVKKTMVPQSKRLRYHSQNDYGINILTHNKNSMSIRDAREDSKVDEQQMVEVQNRQTDDSSKMVEIWNSIIRPPKPETMSTRREQQCFEVLRDHFNNDLDNWREHCVRITKSRYLMGDDFTLYLSWALKPQWIQKVQEGYYDNRKEGNAVSSQPAIQLPAITIDEALSDCDSEVDRKVKEILFHKMNPNAYASWIGKTGENAVVFDVKNGYICVNSRNKFFEDIIKTKFWGQVEQAYAAVYNSLDTSKISLIDHREGVDVDLMIYGNKPLTPSGDILWAK